jgi:tetratricopeptide (TPR) repeat protein
VRSAPYKVWFLFSLIFFAIGPSTINAQTDLIDSLKIVLKNSKQDTDRAAICNALGEYIFLKKPDEALLYFQKAQALCKHNLKSSPSNTLIVLAYKKQLAFAINNIGYCTKTKGQVFKAIEAYESSLKIQEEIGNKEGIATALINLGVIYNDQGDIPKALEYLNRSLNLHEDIKNLKGAAISLDDIGVIYFRQGDLNTALIYYTKALNIREKLQEKDGLATSLINIGVVYRNQHNVDKAIEFYERSLRIMQEIGDKQGEATALNNIGAVYKNEADRGERELRMKKALDYFLRSLKIREEVNDTKGIAISLHNIGSVYLYQKNNAKSIAFGERSMKISQELGYPGEIRKSAELLYNNYKVLKDPKKALHYFDLFILMRDSINNQSTRKASLKTMLKYEYEKQAAADSVAHAKESEIKNAELSRQSAEIKAKKNQQYALYGGLILVLFFSVFMFNRYKVTQKQKDIIEDQKGEVELQKQIVDAKQKEIVDSIQYAKRIQTALLPSEKYISKHLKKN